MGRRRQALASLPARRQGHFAAGFDASCRLLDAGFLIALYDAREVRHVAARQWLMGFRGRLLSVEAVLVEATYMISPRIRHTVLDLVAQGIIELAPVDADGHVYIRELLKEYQDLPADYADAALLWLAERSGVMRILTTDSGDFGIYRLRSGEALLIEDW